MTVSNDDLIDFSHACRHVTENTPRSIHRPQPGCEDCLKIGGRWVHLRVCLTCGHVACCDSSKNRHARRHYERTGHAIIRSFEPGEDWRWCYVDEAYLSAGGPAH